MTAIVWQGPDAFARLAQAPRNEVKVVLAGAGRAN
jgi:hypothetical protein